MDASRTKTRYARLAVLAVVLLAVMALLPVTAHAEIASGESGTVKWSISDEGELVFEPENGVDGTFADDLRENARENYSYRSAAWNDHLDDIATVRFVGTCHAKGSVNRMFSNYNYSNGQNQISAIDLRGLDVSDVTDMSQMFYGCNFVKTLNLSGFDTSNVTNMSGMFAGCEGLGELTFPDSFKTGKVTDMSGMFSGCSDLKALDLTSFDTTAVTNMSGLFRDCDFLESITFPTNWDTKNVINMSSMFSGCDNLVTIDLSKFDAQSLTNCESMFRDCGSLETLTFPTSFKTNKATDMTGMFASCGELKELDLSGFVTSSVTRMSGMFSGCSSLQKLNVSSFDTHKVQSMSSMFQDCSSLVQLDLSSFVASRATSFSYMFDDCSSLEFLNISNLDGNCVTDMGNMFSDCYSLTNINLSGLHTSRVKNMYRMFAGCSSVSSLDISQFDTARVTNMSSMFSNCDSLSSIVFPRYFNANRVTDVSAMFASCPSLKIADLSSMSVSRVTNMSSMFNWCPQLESVSFSPSFKTDHVKNMNALFANCPKLMTVGINCFDTSRVTNMSGMFSGCISISYLDLSNFDTSRVVSMDGMFPYGGSDTRLKSVTLGPKFSFKGRTVDVLCQLPSYSEWRDNQRIEGTWTNKDKGLTYTAEDLAANYNGSTMAGTWTLGDSATTTKDILDATVEVADQEWVGQAVRPDVKVTLDGVTLTPGKDYSASYSDNTDPGEAKVTISGRGNYIGSVTQTFRITRDITGATVSAPEQTYTGKPLTPSVTVALAGQTLPSSAYDVTFSDNDKVGTGHITVTGKDYYSGQASGDFSIVAPVDISNAQVSIPNAQEEWTGFEIKPQVTVKLGEGTLTEGTDYDVAYSNNTDAGTATVTVTGKGRYSGTAQTTFTIVKPDDPTNPDQPSRPDDPSKPDEPSQPDDPQSKTTDITGASVTIDDQTWTGEALEPAVTVKIGDATLNADTDYDVAYESNTEVGAATAIVTGKGSYSGTVRKVFNIRPADLSAATVTADAQTWNGTALAPIPVVALDGKTLPADAYVVTYENNSDVGTATVKATGQGHYTGTAKGSFEITQADVSTAKVFVANQIYAGEAIEPTTIVTLGRTVLDPSADYEASFANNTNPGVATVTITGKGNCTGKTSAEFRIVEAIRARDLSGAKVTAAAKRWTGAALQPDVVVTLDDNTEVPTDGYTVEYSDNTNVGQAKIKVTGKDTTGREDFYGEAYGTFDILPAELEGAQIGVEDQTWDGSDLTPAVTVRLGDVELIAGTDYDVSYENNDAPGTAKVTVTGKGNYIGTASQTFEIKAPDKSQLSKAVDEAAGLTRGNYTEASWDAYQRALSSAQIVLGNAKSTQAETDAALAALQQAKDGLKEEPSKPEPTPEPSPSEPEKPQKPSTPAKVASRPMYRLYNPNSGEHFYTASVSERDNVVAAGWRYEGVGWNAPESGDPVFRLYNPNAGDHHYTVSASERDTLIAAGWKYEGVGWRSSKGHEVPLYRQYNPNAQAGSHNYTTSKSENDHLVSLGWRAEGIGWYGV